ncbi:tripartite tricarboxylate transporter substrate binding protein [Pigmentiphaga soli]|uniref:Bug family tripartite tricarboxylate transporter substrate binding protein n=1 Tax=Pigmentiphaga soli TaxID=1007095 RepID=UPI0031F03B07
MNPLSSHRRNKLALAACAAVALYASAAWPQAQNDAAHYPSRPIRLVVPFAAGGGTDVLARLMAKPMGEKLGQPVVVENVTGAGGTIGAVQVARAAGDGYTLIIGTPGSIQVNPAMQPDLRYNPQKDFIPISRFSDSPVVLVVNKDTPYHSVQDLIDDARKRPGAINVGSAGVGSMAHFSAEMFQYLAKVKFTHIPYRGTSQALTDLRSGALQVEFENLPAVLGLVKEGQLRALAMGSASHSSFLPDLPTLAEKGLPEYESTSWTGLFAPASTPPAIVARLEQAAIAAARDPATLAALKELGAEPVGSTSAEFRTFLERRQPLVEAIVKASNMTTK